MKLAVDLIDTVFHDQKHGLRFFQHGERDKLKLRKNEGKIEIWCIKRERWLRAKPEEVGRQLFLIRIQEFLRYPLSRVQVNAS